MGYYIKEILLERHISQKELAMRIGMSPQQLNNIVRGAANASLPVLEHMAQELHCPVWRLFASPSDMADIGRHPDFSAFIRFNGVTMYFDTAESLASYVTGTLMKSTGDKRER